MKSEKFGKTSDENVAAEQTKPTTTQSESDSLSILAKESLSGQIPNDQKKPVLESDSEPNRNTPAPGTSVQAQENTPAMPTNMEMPTPKIISKYDTQDPVEETPFEKPNVGQPVTTQQPEMTQPRTTRPEVTTRPEMTQPSTTRPEVTKRPEMSQPQMPQSGTTQPGAPQPGTTKPQMPQPGVPQPGATPPQMPQSGTTQPGAPQPGTTQPQMPQPGTTQPQMPQPGAPQPGVPQPEATPPQTPQPGAPQPGVPQPGATQTEIPQFGAAQPEMMQTESADDFQNTKDGMSAFSKIEDEVSDIDQKGKKKKPIARLVVLLAVVVLIIGGSTFFYQLGISAVDKDSKEEITIQVGNQSGALNVLNQLEENGLVRNKFCAKVHLKLFAPDTIQANTYVFTKGMGISEMYAAMGTGNPNYLIKTKVTVREGVTIPEVADEISKECNIPKKTILKKWNSKKYLRTLKRDYWFITDEIFNESLLFPLEGYFYPATYEYPTENPTLEEITKAFLDKMDEELTPLKGQMQKKLGMTVHEFLAFSSVVEAESLFDEDRPKIAGVFVNRIKQGMPLQSDITVLYVLQEKRPKVTIAETRTDSLYNTYMYPGVPVGPVCASQIKTMNDCLNYKKSKYLYFFATKDGKVIYTKTYQEHLKVIEKNKWY